MIRLVHGDAVDHYRDWETPTAIISDGAYGLEGFEGDPSRAEDLYPWYHQHLLNWTRHADSATTLWFWNTELGFAVMHGEIVRAGWVYRGCNVWNKGTGHVAGNVNTGTMRKFPVVTEICAQYVRDPSVVLHKDTDDEQVVRVQDWMRNEWRRAGLKLHHADEACGTKNAASRKYLASDHLWYCPPEAFETLAKYANEHGLPAGRPYFSLDGTTVVSGAQIARLRHKFNCPFGVTNVWNHATVRGEERVKHNGKILHTNQKPKALISRIVEASTDPGDVVWDPFGGLFTTALVCKELGRSVYSSELNSTFFEAGKIRCG